MLCASTTIVPPTHLTCAFIRSLFAVGANSSTFIAGFAAGFIKNWQLTLVMMGMAPLMALSGALMMTLMAGLEKKGQDAYSKAGAVAQERLASIRTVQACGKEEAARLQFNKHCVDAESVSTRIPHSGPFTRIKAKR